MNEQRTSYEHSCRNSCCIVEIQKLLDELVHQFMNRSVNGLSNTKYLSPSLNALVMYQCHKIHTPIT